MAIWFLVQFGPFYSNSTDHLKTEPLEYRNWKGSVRLIEWSGFQVPVFNFAPSAPWMLRPAPPRTAHPANSFILTAWWKSISRKRYLHFFLSNDQHSMTFHFLFPHIFVDNFFRAFRIRIANGLVGVDVKNNCLLTVLCRDLKVSYKKCVNN
jgi:hypothetical protein